MPRFPVDAPKRKAIKAFELLVFRLVREQKHIAIVRENRWYTDSVDDAQSCPDQGLNFENDLHASRHPARRLSEGIGANLTSDGVHLRPTAFAARGHPALRPHSLARTSQSEDR